MRNIKKKAFMQQKKNFFQKKKIGTNLFFKFAEWKFARNSICQALSKFY